MYLVEMVRAFSGSTLILSDVLPQTSYGFTGEPTIRRGAVHSIAHVSAGTPIPVAARVRQG
jgi:hypothetical protein